MSCRLLLAVLAIAAGCGGPQAMEPEVPQDDGKLFHSKAFGFGIEKPDGWHYLSDEQLEAVDALPAAADAEQKARFLERFDNSLVVFVKHTGLDAMTMNPSIQVMVQPAPPQSTATAADILGSMIGMIAIQAEGLEFVEPLSSTTIDGHEAASIVTTYTMPGPGGQKRPTYARVLVVKAGSYFFMISMTSPPSGDDFCGDEFEQALGTIRFGQ